METEGNQEVDKIKALGKPMIARQGWNSRLSISYYRKVTL